MKSILIVDDEPDIVDLLRYNLRKEGYTVLTARNGTEALAKAKHSPDCILLDVMMPERDGWDVLKELKGNPTTASIPVIFLTARGSDVDEVLGLGLGADDYVIKPISVPRLIARMKNVLRRHERLETPKKPPDILRVGAVEIAQSQHIVRIDGKEVFFPKKEFEVFVFLARRLDEVVRREVLLDSVWGTDVQVVDRTVDVHIRKIREKLGKHANYIETIKGVGYRMRGQEPTT